MILAHSQRLRIGERHLEFAGQFVQSHCNPLSRCPGARNSPRNDGEYTFSRIYRLVAPKNEAEQAPGLAVTPVRVRSAPCREWCTGRRRRCCRRRQRRVAACQQVRDRPASGPVIRRKRGIGCGSALKKCCRTSAPTSNAAWDIAGPNQARRSAASVAIAASVSSTTPAARPRQPA